MEEHPCTLSEIHLAVFRADLPAIHSLFENETSPPDLESRSRSMTVLQTACYYGHYDLLPLLLSHGADVNAEPGEGGSALTAAIASISHDGLPHLMWKNKIPEKVQAKQMGQAEAVHVLLEAGADINMEGGEFGSPLGAAAAFGLEDIVELLLARGADVNSSGGRLGSALTAACARGGMPVEWCVSLSEEESYGRIAERLLKAGAKVDELGGIYGTALQAAAFVGDVELVELLLSNGADPNVRGGRYASPLSAAASQGDLEVVGVLLAAGARVGPVVFLPDEKDDRETWREEPVASLFMAYGVPLPNSRVAVSESRLERVDDPIQVARDKGHTDIVTALLAKKL